VDEAEVLAGDKIVPKAIDILVELRSVAEMRVASSTASELFGLRNRHPVAVEVMSLDAPRERQGEGEDGGARYSGLPHVNSKSGRRPPPGGRRTGKESYDGNKTVAAFQRTRHEVTP
jgi:hypothetical protein